MDAKKKRKWKIILGIVLSLTAIGVYVGWDRAFRELPQPDWVMQDAATRFMYASIGAEEDAGIPYWIYYVLPRMFPEKLPGEGGYASLGVPWEEGKEFPIGFTKKTIGFPRVANNCAVCHTTQYRTSIDASPVYVPLGPGHTTNVQGFFRFLIDCAKDPRFNADNIMVQIALNTKLDWIDSLLYRFLIIPITKKRLLEREEQFQWMYNEDYADWGPGRDDAMNLTKYFMIGVTPPDDGTFGPTDFPAIWNLKKYDSPENSVNPQRINYAGDTWDVFSVVIDSALGVLGGEPSNKEAFLDHVNWLTDYTKNSSAPPYPLPIDEALSDKGEVIYQAECAQCHGETGDRVGRPLPLAEVGTSSDRMDTWGKEFAIEANLIANEMGGQRRGLVEEDPIGYNVPHLDGLWLRGPYLHNGSVPNLRELLSPADQRSRQFYRGYDLLDIDNIGFISQGQAAQKDGTLYDTKRKGNRNFGHEFGTTLSEESKNTLLEYLKTL